MREGFGQMMFTQTAECAGGKRKTVHVHVKESEGFISVQHRDFVCWHVRQQREWRFLWVSKCNGGACLLVCGWVAGR